MGFTTWIPELLVRFSSAVGRQEAVGGQQLVHQGPGLGQPADRQMRFLDQHCHWEIR
jgi:hypothetical protein